MSDQVAPADIRTTDGEPLKASLARSMRRQRLKAFLLVAPLLLFIVFTFLLPIGDMLVRSTSNELVPQVLHRTTAALKDWNPKGGKLPGDDVFEAMVGDLTEGRENQTITRVGQRLNYEHSGMSSLFRSSARKAGKIKEGPYTDALIKAKKQWGDIETWKVIKRFLGNYTDGYFLASVDATRKGTGDIHMKDEGDRIYLKLFARTIVLSLVITLTTVIIGFPVAYLLSILPVKTSNILMIFVLLPFWTSLLVRTTSWIALLQQQGVINELLVWIGLVSPDNRLELIHNATGTMIAMTHILLPFMILPLFSVMKTIPKSYVRAAVSLGAHPWNAFWRVYFPGTVPGIGAGGILVFILSIGYYITPELVGGTSGVFISNRIAYHISSSLNWGLAAALGVMLLALVMACYVLYDKIVGIDNMKMG